MSRPPESWSSEARDLASRAGLCQGSGIVATPRRMSYVTPATKERRPSGSSHVVRPMNRSCTQRLWYPRSSARCAKREMTAGCTGPSGNAWGSDIPIFAWFARATRVSFAATNPVGAAERAQNALLKGSPAHVQPSRTMGARSTVEEGTRPFVLSLSKTPLAAVWCTPLAAGRCGAGPFALREIEGGTGAP